VRIPPQPPPRRLRIAGNSRTEMQEPHFYSEAATEHGLDEDHLTLWFRRTYPGYTRDDLADYYRRNRLSPAVVTNPENRYATFKMRMVGMAANYVEQEEYTPSETTQIKADISWLYIIVASATLAAAILVAAAFLTS
jgi:hypothetical protein